MSQTDVGRRRAMDRTKGKNEEGSMWHWNWKINSNSVHYGIFEFFFYERAHFDFYLNNFSNANLYKSYVYNNQYFTCIQFSLVNPPLNVLTIASSSASSDLSRSRRDVWMALTHCVGCYHVSWRACLFWVAWLHCCSTLYLLDSYCHLWHPA